MDEDCIIEDTVPVNAILDYLQDDEDSIYDDDDESFDAINNTLLVDNNVEEYIEEDIDEDFEYVLDEDDVDDTDEIFAEDLDESDSSEFIQLSFDEDSIVTLAPNPVQFNTVRNVTKRKKKAVSSLLDAGKNNLSNF